MDFRGRTPQPPASQPVSQSTNSFSSASSEQFKKLTKQPVGKWFEIASVVLLFSVTILVVAIAFLLYFGGTSQNQLVNKKKYQAVFLNNGQVYFGNVKSFNTKYIDLRNIYYLQTSATDSKDSSANAANSNVSLVKLGCELHAPYDQMIINESQVIFWENLQDNSQVVKAIAQYKQQNPKGQTCSSQSQSSTQQAPASTNSQSQSTTGTGSAAAPSTTAPVTTTPSTTKKP